METYDILEKAFEPDYAVTQPVDDTVEPPEFETLHFYPQLVGKIAVTTGRLVACDPLVTVADAPPFIYDFPHGEFPVELAIARYDDGGHDERIAFARVRFTDAAPVRWDGALSEGEDPAELEEGELFGYAVDSGNGAFMDTAGQKALAGYLEDDEEAYDELEAAFDQTYRATRAWTLWQRGDARAALFTSGLGDGFYPSFVGYDAQGGICRLVTDFGLVEWEV